VARSSKNPLIPARDGVSPSCVALPGVKAGVARWPGVIDFLDERLPTVGREVWAERLATGLVVDEAGQAVPPDAPYRGDTRLYYYRALPNETVVPFDATVLYQDAHLVVADKPHFLPVTPGGRYVQQTLLVRLQRQLGLPQLAPLHRIDRETAGLVLLAVNPAERGIYHALFSGRTMHKTYEAIAPATDALTWPHIRRSRIVEHPSDFYRMNEVAGEPNSETRIGVMEQRGDWARYALEPVSGKRHQLRVHMNALGLPIVGDQLYPTVLHGPDEAEDFANPLRLLARGIAFTDPVTGAPRAFQSQRVLDWPG
jgi:tRNA pseudouridine32 synthase / 23S rRNA pseudouridine746 synthase